MADPQLSQVVTSFDTIRQQIEAKLQSYPSWKDRYASSTGQMLIDFIAGVAVYNRLAVERGVQETYLETAQSPQSIYQLNRLLGVPIDRMVGATVTAVIANPQPTIQYALPAYAEFTINNVSYYCPNTISIPATPPGQTTPANAVAQLNQGKPTTYNFVSDGTPYQLFQAGDADFSADNTNVLVSVDNVMWSQVPHGLWKGTPNSLVYTASTTPTGQVEIQFGNGTQGFIPLNGASIAITVFKTIGAAGNNSATALAVKGVTDPLLTGVTTTASINGKDIRSIDDYRFLTPRLGASLYSANRRQDWNAIMLTYPGIIDVNCVGEAELGPSVAAYQNAVGVVAITQSQWDINQINAFLQWIQDYQGLNTKVLFLPAVQVPVSISVQLYIDKSYSSDQVSQAVTTSLQAMFAPVIGTLGKSVYTSDIIYNIKSVPGVLHCTLSVPTTDTLVSYNQYIVLMGVNITGVTYSN